jgi:hypothetical protein
MQVATSIPFSPFYAACSTAPPPALFYPLPFLLMGKMKELYTALQEAERTVSPSQLLPPASNEGEEPATSLDPFTAYSIKAMQMVTHSLLPGPEAGHGGGYSPRLERYDWETRERGAE